MRDQQAVPTRMKSLAGGVVSFAAASIWALAAHDASGSTRVLQAPQDAARELRPATNWTSGYPSRLSREDIALCGWIHRWPDALEEAAMQLVEEPDMAADPALAARLAEIESRLQSALGDGAEGDPIVRADSRASAFREREELADRMLGREFELLRAALLGRGLTEDDVLLATSTLLEQRKSALGRACAPPLAGAGDCDIRPTLLRCVNRVADPEARLRLDELAAETLPNLESLLRERRRIVRRVVPQSTVLFARMRAASPSERQSLREAREALRSPLANIERRLVESSLLVLQRFQEAAPEDHARRLRQEVLAAIFGSLADDPWDPTALVEVARDRAAADEELEALADEVAALADAQRLEREDRQREALGAVVRLWHEFARSMATSSQETTRATEALARWHGASRAMAEPIAAALERAPIDGVDDGLRRAVAQWRERADSVADSQRRSLLPVKSATR
jgi:hypothetical protein